MLRCVREFRSCSSLIKRQVSFWKPALRFEARRKLWWLALSHLRSLAT